VGRNQEDKMVKKIKTANLSQFMRWVEKKYEGGWIFRGDTKSIENTESSTDRVFKNFKVVDKEQRRNVEKKLIREFQRGAHHYYNDTPDLCDILQWLSLMQHHGAPTRLVDWTYSPYVALYFAINRCLSEGNEKKTRYIHAVDTKKTRRLANKHIKKRGDEKWDKGKDRDIFFQCDLEVHWNLFYEAFPRCQYRCRMKLG
jgi:hypothetical protein